MSEQTIDVVGRTSRDEHGLTRPEAALLAACEIDWSEAMGCWIDRSAAQWCSFEGLDEALDEACARVENGDLSGGTDRGE